MNKPLLTLATLLGVAFLLPAHAADKTRDVEGEVQSIDAAQRSFKVKDVTIHADDRTDFDDEYRAFEDIKQGDRVEVDYIVRDGKNLATEIERDD